MNILISGASRGIGRQLALELASEGHNLLLLSRNIEGLKKLTGECRKIAGRELALPLIFDLSDADGIPARLVDDIVQNIEYLDVLVNNAGAMIRKPFLETELAEARELFDVNFFAPAMLIKALFPLLKKASSPSIVNVTSMAAFQGSSKFKGLSMYGASKGALATLTESLAEEFSSEGIRVNALAFGAVQTEMLEEAFPGYKAPLSASEMGSFFKWFVVEGSRYFNGKMLPVSVSTP